MVWHLIDAYNPVMAARLGRILDQERPDLVNFHNLQGFSVAAWRAAARRGIPVVQTVQDYYLGCRNSVMYRHGRNCRRQCVGCRFLGVPRRNLSHIPVAITSLSRRMLARLEATGLFPTQRETDHHSRQQRRLPQVPPRSDKRPGDDIRFGFLGRLERPKGVELLLAAMLGVSGGHASLRIGGRGKSDYVDYLQRSYGAPNIHFLGFARPADFFASIDALVVPSLWEEPLGRVVHEAYAYGVPVIAAAIGGIAEIVADGVTGHLFPAGDEAALAVLLGRIAAAGFPAAAFFRACRERSLEFDGATIAEQYVAAFRGRCANTAPSDVVEVVRDLPLMFSALQGRRNNRCHSAFADFSFGGAHRVRYSRAEFASRSEYVHHSRGFRCRRREYSGVL